MAAGSVSKMLLPEASIGSSDFDSYLTDFELSVELQNGNVQNLQVLAEQLAK